LAVGVLDHWAAAATDLRSVASVDILNTVRKTNDETTMSKIREIYIQNTYTAHAPHRRPSGTCEFWSYLLAGHRISRIAVEIGYGIGHLLGLHPG